MGPREGVCPLTVHVIGQSLSAACHLAAAGSARHRRHVGGAAAGQAVDHALATAHGHQHGYVLLLRRGGDAAIRALHIAKAGRHALGARRGGRR